MTAPTADSRPAPASSAETPTLADRYVFAVLRGIPEKQRDDVRRELRASIADAVDDRTAGGEDARSAERAVLAELGDPDRLAADYAERPPYLLGPSVYFAWRRIVRVLLAIIVPIVVVAVVIAQLLSRASVGDVAAAAFSTGMGVALHLVFWTTLVFWLAERYSAKGDLDGTWSLDTLPELPRPRVSLADTVTGVAGAALTITFLVLQQHASVIDGERVPILEPSLWTLWLPVLIALIALDGVLDVVAFRRSGWTLPLASASIAVNAAFTGLVIWLTLTGALLNREFFAAVGWPEGAEPNGVLSIIIVVGVAVGALLDAIDKLVKVHKNR